MNADDAKLILSAYRPDPREAAGPDVSAALQQVKHDPVLAEWWAREQAWDNAIADKLAEIAPPPGLRAALLAGRTGCRDVSRAPTAGWRAVVFAVAAMIVVALSLGVVRWQPAATGATLQDFAVNTVANGFFLQKRSSDVAALKAWLAEKQGPIPRQLPTEFAHLRALGCRALSFKGRDVSLVCFEREGKEFHVFVARRGELRDEPVDTTPRFASRGALVAASWVDADLQYVVVSDASMAALRGVL
ncbi:hypothetical protein [Horticoccus sp. 23ND18S-11]|uniref:hypothetical protein n=1 Tax=Horticoccus sp. 23ND18S-11 TaxID=3391832 RepID=UPI0039C8EAA6